MLCDAEGAVLQELPMGEGNHLGTDARVTIPTAQPLQDTAAHTPPLPQNCFILLLWTSTVPALFPLLGFFWKSRLCEPHIPPSKPCLLGEDGWPLEGLGLCGCCCRAGHSFVLALCQAPSCFGS